MRFHSMPAALPAISHEIKAMAADIRRLAKGSPPA
jgi:hypothetical protein